MTQKALTHIEVKCGGDHFFDSKTLTHIEGKCGGDHFFDSKTVTHIEGKCGGGWSTATKTVTHDGVWYGLVALHCLEPSYELRRAPASKARDKLNWEENGNQIDSLKCPRQLVYLPFFPMLNLGFRTVFWAAAAAAAGAAAVTARAAAVASGARDGVCPRHTPS